MNLVTKDTIVRPSVDVHTIIGVMCDQIAFPGIHTPNLVTRGEYQNAIADVSQGGGSRGIGTDFVAQHTISRPDNPHSPLIIAGDEVSLSRI